MLLAYWVSKNSYMKYLPFQQLYNQGWLQPKDIKHKLPSIVNLDPDEISDKDIFGAAWISFKVIRKEMSRQERLRKISNVVTTTVIFLQHQVVLVSALIWSWETTYAIIENKENFTEADRVVMCFNIAKRFSFQATVQLRFVLPP